MAFRAWLLAATVFAAGAFVTLAQRQLPTQAQLTIVTTADGLQAALDGGARHVEIQEHLDLRTMTYVEGENDSPRFHFVLHPNTRSIRGNCVGAIPDEFRGLSPPVRMAQGQCALLTRHGFAQLLTKRGSVWMDKLYVRLARPTPLPASEPYTTLVYAQKTSLYATNVTLQGDGLTNSSGLYIWSSTYLADSAVSNFGGRQALRLRLAGKSAATIARCTFTINRVRKATIHLVRGSAMVKACQFVSNSPLDMLVSGDAAVRPTKLYYDSDSAIAVDFDPPISSVASLSDIPVAPLADMPEGSSFPGPEDPDFVAIRAEALGAESSPGVAAIVTPQPLNLIPSARPLPRNLQQAAPNDGTASSDEPGAEEKESVAKQAEGLIRAVVIVGIIVVILMAFCCICTCFTCC